MHAEPLVMKPPSNRLSALEVERCVKDCKVIMSFGGARGGFELAYQMREDIMQAKKLSHPANVYLDAETLRSMQGTRYKPTWADQLERHQYGVKMDSHYWDDFYYGALGKAKTMVFFVTLPWLKSSYTWQEFNWMKDWRAKGADFKVILIEFPDVRGHLNLDEDFIYDRDDKVGRKTSPLDLFRFFLSCKQCVRIQVASQAPVGNEVAISSRDGTTNTFQYNYNYALSGQERAQVLQELVV